MDKILALVAAVLCHEAGHVLACRFFRVPIRNFSMAPLGCTLRYDTSRLPYAKEGMIALAGPFAGILFAWAAGMLPLSRLRDLFRLVSLALAVFNLLPIRHLDGGVFLYAVLRGSLGLRAADRVLGVLSPLCTVLLWGCAVTVQIRSGGNLSLLVLSVVLLCDLRRK